jgi:hypothetical protein
VQSPVGYVRPVEGQLTRSDGWRCPTKKSRGGGPVLRVGHPIRRAHGLHPRLFFQFDRLDLVTNLDVVELAEPNTALEPVPNLGDVVFEATQ